MQKWLFQCLRPQSFKFCAPFKNWLVYYQNHIQTLLLYCLRPQIFKCCAPAAGILYTIKNWLVYYENIMQKWLLYGLKPQSFKFCSPAAGIIHTVQKLIGLLWKSNAKVIALVSEASKSQILCAYGGQFKHGLVHYVNLVQKWLV